MSGFFYRTTSQLNGDPILVVCVESKSVGNSKTGTMAQVYILPDVGPGTTAQQAWMDGTSYDAVCGDCKHRTYNTCYVKRFHGSSSVLAAVYRGRSYEEVTHGEFARRLSRFDEVRFGADGDPAAIPKDEFVPMAFYAKAWTGYTHQWDKHEYTYLRTLLMASVDTPEEFALARARQWRTFRVRLKEEPLYASEFVCPASAEAGHRTQCQDCLACDGADDSRPRAANPTIIIHAAHLKYHKLRLSLANR